MLDCRDIAYLVACVQAGTLGGAAQSLKLSTSTLSRHITRLEDELGLALLERGRFGVRLTPAGRVIIPHAELALRELDAIRRTGFAFGCGAEGAVRLGVRFPQIGEPITSLLRAWRERHPRVGLSVAERSDDDLGRALGDREVDVILTFAAAIPDRAASQPLFKERLVAALPEGHSLAGGQTVGWADCRRETILVQDAALQAAISSHLGDDGAVQFHKVSLQSLLTLVAAGFGATFVPASQARTPFPGVVFKHTEPLVALDLALAWLPELEDATVGRFVACMRETAPSRTPI